MRRGAPEGAARPLVFVSGRGDPASRSQVAPAVSTAVCPTHTHRCYTNTLYNLSVRRDQSGSRCFVFNLPGPCSQLVGQVYRNLRVHLLPLLPSRHPQRGTPNPHQQIIA